MAKSVHDRWLPLGTRVSDVLVLGQVIASGSSWQIANAAEGSRALIVRENLKNRWIESGLLDAGRFVAYSFGEEWFYVLEGGTAHVLAPLSRSESPNSKSAAMSFAKAMAATRTIGETASLVDGIFVERLSRILPTYTSNQTMDDALILGTWLTGGIPVDARSAQVANLLTWISPGHLQDILELAGLEPVEKPFQAGSASSGMVSGLQNGQRFALPGRAALEAFFNDHVVDVVQNSDRYKALGMLSPPSVVLAGPPGCGKTVAVAKLVEFLGWPCFSVQADSIGSPYIHDTSRKISDLFQRAIDTAPSVMVIDEMDAFLAERDAAPSNSHRVEEIAEFLRRIPEATKAGVLIIGMTNRLDSIDWAILRRGRFDHIVKVDFATQPEVNALLETLTAGLPLDDDVELSFFGKSLAGRPLSDAAFVVREGARLAAKKRAAKIDAESLQAALASALAQDQSKQREPVGFFRMREQ